MKTKSLIPLERLQSSLRTHFNPIRTLKPNTLSRILDQFHQGHLREAALLWDAIERRDDIVQSVASKRKKAVARLHWDILTLDDSPQARLHKEALTYFYNNLTCTHACDPHEQGGLRLLIKQMMDAIGKKYCVHEIIFSPQGKDLTACFKFVPLWFFKRTEGTLTYSNADYRSKGIPVEIGSWLVTHGEGLMEACSIAYLFKNLPLRDWLIYCERNGMPGVKGITDAPPDSKEWQTAKEAVEDFGSEFHALMSRGTDIQPIDLTARGELPYPKLIERMDRALAALWRGSDLSTLAKEAGIGASLQAKETQLLEEDDANLISETLNTQVDRIILKHLFKVERGKAYFKLIPRDTHDKHQELDLCRNLWEMGLPLSTTHLAERFGISLPQKGEKTLQKK